VLRTEERQAWQRLIRVLGHEIGNSLAPIQSLAGSLRGLLDGGAALSDEMRGDLRDGLGIIDTRAQALSRFMTSYATLARLPPPNPGPVVVRAWVERVAALETRVPVRVEPGPELTLTADGDQLDQLLINVLKNAADATLAADRGQEAIVVGWELAGSFVDVLVRDRGTGISNPDNLFVPFFTTKPSGCGIGLVLSRQIAEAHRGSLSLANADGGCEARVRLPR
jgi:two-component system, NtrC family, nitrogen regulation sensor histidine kinase NtrY